jgi:hypothetical protein
MDRFGVSERHACRVVGQRRATQRNAPTVPDDSEMVLRAWLRAFSLTRPRWGWRRAAVMARGEGRVVNNKRIHRLCGPRASKSPIGSARSVSGDWSHQRRHVPDQTQRTVGPRLPVRPDA